MVVLFSGGRSRWWGYGSRQGCWCSTVQLCSLLWCSLSLEEGKAGGCETTGTRCTTAAVKWSCSRFQWKWSWLAVSGYAAVWKKRSRCRCWSEETLLSWGLLLLLGVTGATREEEPSLHGWKGEEDCLGCLEGGDERFIGHGLLFVGAAIAEDFVVKEDEVAAEGKNGREMVWSWIGGDMDMISIKARGRKGGMVAVVTGKGMNGCCWWVRVFALLFWLKEEEFLCF